LRLDQQGRRQAAIGEAMMWLLALLFIAVCLVLVGVVYAITLCIDQSSTPEERAAWDRKHRQ
jgi:hypothetical protein